MEIRILEQDRVQYCVGQGFFHSGRLRLGAAQLHYVYDCGANKSFVKQLRSELGDYLDRDLGARTLDVLFVSHLHDDHISGLDQLLVGPVRRVVLPYLDPVERLVLVAKALDEGALTGTDLSLLTEQEGWFGRRGVDEVIVVRGSEDLETPPPELPPTAETPEDAESLDLSYLAPSSGGPSPMSARAARVEISDREPMVIRANGHAPINWVFLTLVQPISQHVLDQFRGCVETEFKPSDPGFADVDVVMSDPRHLARLLGTRSRRKALIACYEPIAHDLNLTSLALYSGPLRWPPSEVEESRAFGNAGIDSAFSMVLDYWRAWVPINTWRAWLPINTRICDEEGRVIGWIGTGDADLKSARGRQRFRKHFGPVAPMVSILTLPHHGSWRNFHRDALFGPPLRYCVSSANTVNRHHPDPRVLHAVTVHGCVALMVSERPETSFVERLAFRR